MGLGEASKIALIVIGVAPTMIRDLALKALELPREQIVKAETLGGSSWQIGLRVVLPQILPRLITCLRLQLGPAWLFLIAAEAISSDSGLGYRIFLVRRYLSMDVIFPYVVWITLLAVIMLFLGTLFAPTQDRDAPKQGFTHKIGDVVEISSAGLGALVNTVRLSTECPPWTFGISALMSNLAKRGLL